MKLTNKVSKKPKRNMAEITKILRQVKRSGKKGKRKRTLMEKQIITLLSKKGSQTRKPNSRKAKWCGECHTARHDTGSANQQSW